MKSKENTREYTQAPKEYTEKVIQIDRISRTVKGGRRIRFRALVVVGNQKGKAGFGVAKGKEVLEAINKAVNSAKKRMLIIQLNDKETINREVRIKYCGAQILLKPAPKGTSLIAGGSIRAVIEAFGIKNITAKSIGSANKINLVKATFQALRQII
ncbi:MAG: 30S ribosomal subunit protein S5 [Candidatus Berkelbacteria bacterium Licking1014_85]|uniref:Small ribosomal subunit protein uS5 n=1 Tax=Candidatus Berkelbacteria bacterium Licking1014_85 TaxID=2017148 RepID=A0A554LM21_9BACT|nr:MAG: 30S ribosomal subunit protein S5 [Candidatus Berkelbacteria bacterium Licking1014_85]